MCRRITDINIALVTETGSGGGGASGPQNHSEHLFMFLPLNTHVMVINTVS